MTATPPTELHRYEPADPTDMSLVGLFKHYSATLVTTDQGRWCVLLGAMLSIFEIAIYGVRLPPEVQYWTSIATIVALAFLLNMVIDLARVAFTDDGGER